MNDEDDILEWAEGMGGRAWSNSEVDTLKTRVGNLGLEEAKGLITEVIVLRRNLALLYEYTRHLERKNGIVESQVMHMMRLLLEARGVEEDRRR